MLLIDQPDSHSQKLLHKSNAWPDPSAHGVIGGGNNA
jgi:hypothetical protein